MFSPIPVRDSNSERRGRPELHLHSHLLVHAVPQQTQLDLLPDLALLERAVEVVGAAHGLPVELPDHVPEDDAAEPVPGRALDPGLGGRSALPGVEDQDPFDPERVAGLLRRERDPEDRPHDFAKLQQVFDAAGDAVDGDGEADAVGAARGGVDSRVDAW